MGVRTGRRTVGRDRRDGRSGDADRRLAGAGGDARSRRRDGLNRQRQREQQGARQTDPHLASWKKRAVAGAFEFYAVHAQEQALERPAGASVVMRRTIGAAGASRRTKF
jgi:hypothetical protein